MSIRNTIQKYVGELPKIPDAIPSMTFDSVSANKYASIWENIPSVGI